MGQSERPIRAARRSRAPILEDRADREARYDRVEALTRRLSIEVQVEISRRKEVWEVEGDREEEALWEHRKNEVFGELNKLADEIERLARDRQKEEVMEMWSQEQEVRRVSPSQERNRHIGRRQDETREGLYLEE